MLFLDGQYRALYANWDDQAQLAVASLRLVAGRNPDDRSLAELVGQLAMNIDEFAARWARHPVRTCTSGVKHLRHPLVGTVELSFENLAFPDTSGQHLIAFTAEPGSPSEAALRILGSERDGPVGAGYDGGTVTLSRAHPVGA
jgi:hypothetical protein